VNIGGGETYPHRGREQVIGTETRTGKEIGGLDNNFKKPLEDINPVNSARRGRRGKSKIDERGKLRS